jgi:uncharacterized membrane protein YhhN
MTVSPAIPIASCLMFVLGLLVSEARSWGAGKIVFKLLASTSFVWLAVALGDNQSGSGRWMLLAFVLCWVGDAFLLSKRKVHFMAGLVAFLLGHVAFAVAFVKSPGGAAPGYLVVAVLGLCGGFALRWLWPHVNLLFRVAISAYILAILSMCAMAIGLSSHTGIWYAAMGAVTFAVSDLAVARERFVAPSLGNKLWGLPLYYVGQLLIAWSQQYHGTVAT